MASFQENLSNPAPDCQTFLDLAAARCDGGGYWLGMLNSNLFQNRNFSHTLHFNGHFPGEPRLKQRMMEVVVTTGAIGRAKLQ